MQEVTTRLPGRVDAAETSFASTSGPGSRARRAEAAHGEHEKRTGERDENWPDWYAAYMVAEQAGMRSLPNVRARHPARAGAQPDRRVVVIGGSAGIGLETARRSRAEGAEVILTARNPGKLEQAAAELGARNTATFDATDFGRLERFFDELPTPIDHVLVTGPRSRTTRPWPTLTASRRTTSFDTHQWLAIAVAQHAVGKDTGGRHAAVHGGHRRAPPVGRAGHLLRRAAPRCPR